MMESSGSDLPYESPDLSRPQYTEGSVPYPDMAGDDIEIKGPAYWGEEPSEGSALVPSDEGSDEREVAYQPPQYETSAPKEDPNGPPSKEELTNLSGLLGQIEPDVESYTSPYVRVSTNPEQPEEVGGRVVTERLSIWGESQGGQGFEGPTSDIYVTQDAQDGSTHVIRRDNVAGKDHELTSEEVHRLNVSLGNNEGRNSYSPFDANPNLGPRPEVRHRG